MQSHEEGWKHPQADAASSSKGTKFSPMLIGFALLAILALIFIIQNSRRAQIDFLFYHHFGRQWVNILVSMAVGVILDRLFSLWWHRRKRAPKQADK